MSNKKIIIYIGGFKLPDKTASAVRLLDNAYLLKEMGYTVLIIGRLPLVNGKKIRHIEINGFDCYEIEKPIENYYKFKSYEFSIANLINIIDNVGAQNVYSVIAYNYPSIALLKIINYTRSLGIIPISECTEWYPWQKGGLLGNIKMFLDTEFRIRYVSKKANNIICSSSYFCKYYTKHNTIVWPFSVNTSLDRWKQSKDIKNNEITMFLYTGNPGHGIYKESIDLTITAFYELKKEQYSFKYIIIGITKEEYLKVFSDHEFMLDYLDDSVVFMGRVSHEKSLSALKKTDFMLFTRPYTRDNNVGFPTKMMESITLGVPVITNKTSDIDEYIKDGYNGFMIEKHNLKSLKFTIEKSLNISKDAMIMMKKAQRIENPFSIDVIKTAVEDFFNSIAIKNKNKSNETH